ncbi:MAG: DNA repair protein RadA, partial [Deltaproteobacteria bacterium]|nr:DNA repair protein RadA [Deltaproteobacteria bacterium]
MARTKTIYVCQGCGNNSHKWLGKCPDCGGWNTFVEERVEPEKKSAGSSFGPSTPPRPISTLNMAEEDRVSTNISELDRVLGGGLVPGSAVLIGGDPGIGKSTLLLQAMGE